MPAMCSVSSSNLSETDSRSSSTAAATVGGVGSSRKRSRKDTGSGKSTSQDCRRLSERIAHALRKPKFNISDSENVGGDSGAKDDTRDNTETIADT